MIEYKRGNILREDAEALVNSVNCVGVMGRGIALQFKKAWPENFKAFAAACRQQEVRPGRPFVFETGQMTNPRYIINFPTKRHWRGKARIGDVEVGLQTLVDEIQARGIRSVALPPLGTGLGGLDWEEVRTRIEKALGSLEQVRVVLFEPAGTPELPKSVRAGNVPQMTPARAAMVGLMDRYLNGLLDPFVSLLEVHKLMYFMQEVGEPLKLRFVKGIYGPYAENLRHLLNTTEGYYTSGYGAGGDRPAKVLEIVPGAAEDAHRFLEEQPETGERFERVADLVDGFESPFGLELLSTVHWIITREDPASEDELISMFRSWADRKKQFTPNQVRLATKVLREKGWIKK